MLSQAEICMYWSTCSSLGSLVLLWRLQPSALVSLRPSSFYTVPSPSCCCVRGIATLCILPGCRLGRGASAAVRALLSLAALMHLFRRAGGT